MEFVKIFSAIYNSNLEIKHFGKAYHKMELKKSFLEKYFATIKEKIMVFKCITNPKSGKSQNTCKKITAKRTLTRTSSSYYVKVQKKPVSKTNSIGF